VVLQASVRESQAHPKSAPTIACCTLHATVDTLYAASKVKWGSTCSKRGSLCEGGGKEESGKALEDRRECGLGTS
jgi:hypothetical protein